MVGSHTIISTNQENSGRSDFSILKHEAWYKIDPVFKDSGIQLIFSYYEGYPFNKWEDENYFILLEGMIYNYTDNEIGRFLKNVADEFCLKGNYQPGIKEFVENADGDYIVQIYDRKSRRYILFNDFLGRLPVYYSNTTELTVISKDIKFILDYIPKINLDNSGIIENLILGYTLGDKTLFKNVSRLKPCEYVLCSISESGIQFNVGSTSNFDFLSRGLFDSEGSILEKIAEQFLKATENRVKKLREERYEIIADLSGGYDSRAVIGALCKYDRKITYFTNEYVQDESKEAGQLFEELGNPGVYKKTNFENQIDLENISELVFKTDGLVNYFTTSICYNDSKHIQESVTGKVAHFGGFGGEFIRHPEKRWLGSIIKGLLFPLYSNLTLAEACLISNSDFMKIKNSLLEYFNSYKEQNKNDILKHFYYEYYGNYVGSAGEERERIFRWQLHPMWSKDVINIISHHLPLFKTGYAFFIDFMKLIDSRLLNAPIFNSDIDLNSEESIDKFEKNYQDQFKTKTILYNRIKNKIPWLKQFYRRLKGRGVEEKNNKLEKEQLLSLFYSYYNKLDKTKSLFNIKYVEKYIYKAGGQYNRLITLVMYLSELEKRFTEKIIVEDGQG